MVGWYSALHKLINVAFQFIAGELCGFQRQGRNHWRDVFSVLFMQPASESQFHLLFLFRYHHTPKAFPG